MSYARRYAVFFVALFSAGTAHAAHSVFAMMGVAPVGYGQHTVGGCTDPSCVCEVTSLSDSGPGSLRDCVSTITSKWVVFSKGGRGTIHLRSPLMVHSHKTIDGRGLTPITLTIAEEHVMIFRNASNIIVNELKFSVTAISRRCESPVSADDTIGCGGGILVDGSSKNIWVHQNLFEECGGKCIALWTLRSNQKGADLVTISNNVFRNSFYGVLMGVSHNFAYKQKPLMRATLYRNYFYNVNRRSPRASGSSHMHAFNNVVENWGDDSCRFKAFGASSVSGAQMLLTNNYFAARANAKACKTAVHIDGGYVKAEGNVRKNGALVSTNFPERVFNPKTSAPDHYDYIADRMTNMLRAQIIGAAGPRWAFHDGEFPATQ